MGFLPLLPRQPLPPVLLTATQASCRFLPAVLGRAEPGLDPVINAGPLRNGQHNRQHPRGQERSLACSPLFSLASLLALSPPSRFLPVDRFYK